MKKFGIILLILFLLVGGFFGYKFVKNSIEKARIEEIKKGWYIEVQVEKVNIRKESNKDSSKLGEAKEGDVFQVFDMEVYGSNYWYYVEYEKGKKGWIANPTNTEYLNDVNNPEDVKYPTIWFDSVCYVANISVITTDACGVVLKDDRDVSELDVDYIVFHELDKEKNKDQYWIQWIVTDKSGKTAKKVQKIDFATRPKESEVTDFNKLERK